MVALLLAASALTAGACSSSSSKKATSAPGGTSATTGGSSYETAGITKTSILVTSNQLGNQPLPFGDLGLGVTAVFDKVNQAGGIFGRKIDYQPFTSNFDPAKGLQLCRQEVEQNHPFAFVGDNPIVAGENCYDLLGQNKIPVVGTDGVSFRSFAYPTIWNFNMNIYDFYRTSGYFAAKLTPKPQKLAGVFTGGTQSFTATAQAAMNLAKSMGVSSVQAPIMLPVTQTDFTAVVSQLKSDGVDTLVLAYSPSSIVPFLATMAQQNWHPTIVLGMQDHDIRFTKAYAQYLSPNQAMFLPAQTYLPETGGGLFSEYAADVKAIKPDGVLFSQGFQAWAAAKLFVQALQAIGPDPTRTKLINYINGLHNYSAGLSPETYTWPTTQPDQYRWIPIEAQLVKYDVANATWTNTGGMGWTDAFWATPPTSVLPSS